MVNSIGAGSGASLMDIVALDSSARVGVLEKQIAELQKQMRTLQKKLMDATDPAVRAIIVQELDALSKMTILLQQQIELIETAEERKKSLLRQVDPAAAKAAEAKST